MTSPPRIAIVGAGPGGLMLARVLHLHGIHAQVFERDTSPETRAQGGTLDMHAETGQYALKTAQLWEAFLPFARYEDQGLRLYDKQGRLAFSRRGWGQDDHPEIDRGQLRQLLLQSIPAEFIHWDKTLAGVPRLDKGAVTLQFRDGAAYDCDLVVGADGAWSRVRPLVSKAAPAYSGITFYELEIVDADRSHREIANLVGHGLMFALGDSQALIAQRNANSVIKLYAALRRDESWQASNNPTASQDEVRSALAAQFHGWDERLLQLLDSAGGQMTPRPIYELAVDHRWKNRPGVTLLGDAAHLMSPFAGQGANLAMLDAAELAIALTDTKDWRAAVRSYEETMFPRAEEAARLAAEGLHGTFTEDALTATVDDMERLFGGNEVVTQSKTPVS